MIRQGDIVWADFGMPVGSGPGFRRPAVVVQSDRFNDSAISTIIVACITSTLKLQHAPGNVRLARHEANLKRPSVVNVTQIATIDRSQVLEKIGQLRRARLVEVLDGIGVVLTSGEW